MTLPVFPDVEQALQAVFTDGLADDPVPAGTRIPNPRPPRFVRYFRSGGPEETIVTDAALVTVEAWAAQEAAAIALLNRCRSILRTTNGTLYHAREFGGPTNLPDPDVPDQARYTASWQIRARLSFA